MKEEETVNLLEAMNDMPAPKKEEVDDGEDKYYPHWKPEININLLADHTKYQVKMGIPNEILKEMRLDSKLMAYEPIIYLSDFWCLNKHMIPLNDSLDGSSLNLTLNFQNYASYYFQFQKNFETQHASQHEMGLQPFDFDEMKRMYLETDKILLCVTMIVSLLHTVFEILAFKNDIQFWNNKEELEGISVKTLYFQLIQSIVIFLYLFDNETSFMIVMSNGFGIGLEVWKICKASKVEYT